MKENTKEELPAEQPKKRNGAPLGNQFWKLASKHGRDKLFTTAALMKEACCEYFEETQNTPYYRPEQRRGGGKSSGEEEELVYIPTQRPFTFQGLCRYLGCNVGWFVEFEKNIILQLADPEKKKDEAKFAELKEFSIICTWVREVIYQQKYELAAIGALNPLFISRDKDMNMADRMENRQVDAAGNDVKHDTVQVMIIGGKEVRF